MFRAQSSSQRIPLRQLSSQLAGFHHVSFQSTISRSFSVRTTNAVLDGRSSSSAMQCIHNTKAPAGLQSYLLRHPIPVQTCGRQSYNRFTTNVTSASGVLEEKKASGDPSRPSSEASSASSLTAMLHQVAQIQSKLGVPHEPWVERVVSTVALQDGPFRLTIIGDTGNIQSKVAAALLDLPNIPAIEKSKIFKARYGVTDESVPFNEPHTFSIHSPLPWLGDNNVEVYLIPSLNTIKLYPDAVQDVLYKSDSVLLVTSLKRELTGVVDEMIVRNLLARGKQNVVIVAETDSDMDIHKQEKAVASLEVKLAEELLELGSPSMTDPKLPPILTLSATKGNHTGPSVDGITSVLAGFFKDAHKIRIDTISFLAWSALQNLSSHHKASTSSLKEAHTKIKDAAKQIVEHEQRLVREFRELDLGVVQSSIVSLSDSFKSYFTGMPFWKLFWRSDFIAEDLFKRMTSHSFVRAEFQMTYATGKANEALYQLNNNLVDRLYPMTVPTHALALHPITAALQENISRLLNIVKRHTPSKGDSNAIIGGTTEIDMFLLRNEVAAFDETQHCDMVQKQAHGLVQRQIGVQFLVYLGALLATHLGVPLAVGIPGTILMSSFGLFWMSLRWSAVQRRFLRDISESQKTLKNRLSTAYDNEFTRVVAAPLAVSVKMIEEAVQQRTTEAIVASEYMDELSCKIKANTKQ
ncbi:hypothetical protein BASA50_001858 [Batrachochytrium salamandrivorans]|uniref:Mmc1 C-terminal domain-containing protein n=1 Tax=Batrachochytrium salamandrivorans TaxID=1357716 RepID=A0ABQ8FN06_9FUNG|nr:hypothetical protein BASA50_001858 [Batrachochytrium salamandrivorans]